MRELLFALPALAAAQGYVQLNVEKRTPSRSPNDVRLPRRASSGPIYVPVFQDPDKLEYIVNITVGSSAQSMGVTLDTGSSDLWIPSASFCRQNQCDLGDFDPTRSTSFTVIEEGQFKITYAAPGDSDAGDWVTDSVSINGATAIQDQIFGLASTGADQHGVLGLGFDTNEVSSGPGDEQTSDGTSVYPSIMDNLVSQKIINRKAYSVYLDSLNQTTGAIILGGVDSTKYSGPLVVLPLQPSPNSNAVSEFYVTLTSVAFNDAVGKTSSLTPPDYAQNVLLDTGTSATLLGSDVIGALVNGLGGVDAGTLQYSVPCGYAKTNASVTYTFGGSDGVQVTVPVSELINEKISNECGIDVGPALDGDCIMGDSFLRSAYVVFDLDNKLAAVAQAVNARASTSQILAISSGTSIPGATSTATATGTYISQSVADATPSVPAASYTGARSSIVAGTPTFNLGAAATSAGASSAVHTSRRAAVSLVAWVGLIASATLIL